MAGAAAGDMRFGTLVPMTEPGAPQGLRPRLSTQIIPAVKLALASFAAGVSSYAYTTIQQTGSAAISLPVRQASLALRDNGTQAVPLLTDAEISRRPSWFAGAAAAIQEVAALDANWDGYGAPTIPVEALRGARALLSQVPSNTPEPTIVPSSLGAIQFEWHPRGVDLEIEVFSREKAAVLFDDHSGDQEREFDERADSPVLVQLLLSLAGLSV